MMKSLMMLAMEAAAMSFEDKRCKLDDAIAAKFGKADGSDSWKYYSVETFDNYVIARGADDKLFRIPYAIDVNDEVQLGEPQEVETAYIPVNESATFVMEADSADPWKFPVRLIKSGFAGGTLDGNAMPHYYTKETVAQIATLANGTRFGRRHPTTAADAQDPDRIAGWFEGGKLVGEGAVSTLSLLKSETIMQQRFVAAREANKLGDLFQLSIYGYVAFRPGVMEGRKCLVSGEVGKLLSVDLVPEAGAGGKFLVAASKDIAAEISQLQDKAIKTPDSKSGNTGSPKGAGRNNGGAMKDRILKVLEALRKLNAGAAEKLTTEFTGLSEDKHGEFFDTLNTRLVAECEAAATNTSNGQAVADALKLVKESVAEVKKVQQSAMIDRKIAESKLSAPAQKLVREHLSRREQVADADVDAEIVSVREAFAAFTSTGRIVGSTAVGLDTTDKVQLALDQLLGVKEAVGKGVKGFRGVREAYAVITGDSEMRFGRGGTGGFMSVSEAIASGDFANLLLNSMTKRLIQDYAEVGMGGLDQLVSTGSPIGDYKTQHRTRMGYLGDLPIVAEAGPYTELTKPTDDLIQYAVQKRGGELTISEETIRNDDLGKIAAFPSRLARAGRRTLKQFITNFFINNPAYDADTVAWFNAAHNNLGAAALSVDNLNAVEILLAKQTEKDSNKPLGLSLDWIMVPLDLKAAAFAINNSETFNPGPGLVQANPWYKRFGQNGERIIVNELLADTNDWYAGTLPANAPFLEVGYLDGYDSPQIYLANLPTQGTQFSNDQLQYKVKFVFGGDIIDFRGVQKNVV
jgi:hypothetical protein